MASSIAKAALGLAPKIGFRSARPAPSPGTPSVYFDLDIGELISSDGVTWRLGGGQPAITPLDVSGVSLWLKADQGVYSDAGVTPAVNGGTVQQWNDFSGNNRHAIQTTAANQPLLATNVLNGRPAIRFDGTNDRFVSAFTTDPGCIFIVYKVAALGANGTAQSLMGGDTSDAVNIGSYYLQSVTSGANNAARRAQYSRTTSADTSSVSWFAGSQPEFAAWQMATMRSDKTTYLEFGKRDLTATGAIKSGAVTIRPVGGNSPLIGAAYYANNAVDFFNGDIAEIIVFATNPSDVVFNQMTAYLNRKYNLQPTGRFTAFGFHASSANMALNVQQGDGTLFTYKDSHFVTTTGCRDPSVVRDSRTGVLWMSYTTAIGSSQTLTSFGLAKSLDNGQTWAKVTDVDCSAVVSTSGARVWAPELFYDDDGSLHAFFSGTSGGASGNFVIYHTEPAADDYLTWATPAAITGTSLPANMIDAFILKTGATYNMFFKNEASGAKYLGLLQSTSIATGYTVIQSGTTDAFGTGQNVEGPQVLVPSAGIVRLYYDNQGGGWYYIENYDGTLATWTAPVAVSTTFRMQHPSLLVEPA